MKTYTANEIQVIINKAWERGLKNGRTYAATFNPEPPTIGEITDHDYGSSLLLVKKTEQKLLDIPAKLSEGLT